MDSLANRLREITALLPEGEVTKKPHFTPVIKPPRRNPSFKNKSNRSDYMKLYMKEYREEGKDYQKAPEKVKEWRKKQRNQFKEKVLNKD